MQTRERERSTLRDGKAMRFPPKDEFPTRAEVLASIPEDCFKKDTVKSLLYAAISTAMTLGCGVLAYMYIPLQLAFWPAWFAYAAVTGTIATGCWVGANTLAHFFLLFFKNERCIASTDATAVSHTSPRSPQSHAESVIRQIMSERVSQTRARASERPSRWVIAHECGHNAFSDNRAIQDAVGYILHSFLLVPYFSWQRSHAVHHSRTNHLTEGETHVPYVKARGGVSIDPRDSGASTQGTARCPKAA